MHDLIYNITEERSFFFAQIMHIADLYITLSLIGENREKNTFEICNRATDGV